MFACAQLLYELYLKGYNYRDLRRNLLNGLKTYINGYGWTPDQLAESVEVRFVGICKSGLTFLNPRVRLYYPRLDEEVSRFRLGSTGSRASTVGVLPDDNTSTDTSASAIEGLTAT